MKGIPKKHQDLLPDRIETTRLNSDGVLVWDNVSGKLTSNHTKCY